MHAEREKGTDRQGDRKGGATMFALVRASKSALEF